MIYQENLKPSKRNFGGFFLNHILKYIRGIFLSNIDDGIQKYYVFL